MKLSLTLALLLLVFPAAAQAAWVTEGPVASDALQVSSFAFDGYGRGLLLYEGFRDRPGRRKFTALATRTPGGEWLRADEVGDISWGNARIALYARDQAFLVAVRSRSPDQFNRARWELVAARGNSSGDFEAPRTLDRDGSDPVLAVNRRGHAIAGWTKPDGRFSISERSPRSRFARPRAISPKGAQLPAVAINARGDVLAAWGRRGRIEARIRRAGRGWGRIMRVGDPRFHVHGVNAALSPTGRALVTWSSVRWHGELGPWDVEQGIAYRDRRWRNARLDQFVDRRFFAGAPAALPRFDPRGRALVAWTGPPADELMSVKVARVTRERFEVFATLPAHGMPLEHFAVSENGALALSWSAFDSSKAGPFVTVARDGTHFSAPADLHEAGSSAGSTALAFRFETPFLAWTVATPRLEIRVAREHP